jgi:hypothetical protein
MTAASYIFTLGTAAGAAFLIVLGLGIGAHAVRLRRLGFTVIREDDHD